mgnify:CR=1 FL=1
MTEIQLFNHLRNDTGISTIVSNRVYNGPLPEGATLPAITFEYVTDTPENTLCGDTGAAFNRYSISAWANTYAQAQNLKQAIKQAMNAQTRLALVPLHDHKERLYRFAIDYSLFEG